MSSLDEQIDAVTKQIDELEAECARLRCRRDEENEALGQALYWRLRVAGIFIGDWEDNDRGWRQLLVKAAVAFSENRVARAPRSWATVAEVPVGVVVIDSLEECTATKLADGTEDLRHVVNGDRLRDAHGPFVEVLEVIG